MVLALWKHQPPLWSAMLTSNKNRQQTEKRVQRNGMPQIAEFFSDSGNKLGNDKQSCGIPPESKWWRKDLRSIPKVFLIDAYEVS
jgi:hypothetical protein